MTEYRITGKTRLVALLGSPVRHSQSPQMHNTAFQALNLNYTYLVFDIQQNQLEAAIQAMKTLDVAGFNVTMPHKEKVIPFLDELSPEASIIGAVNTVKNENGKLTGYNTDGMGFIMSLAEENIPVSGKKIIILGAGGAGKSVAIQLALENVGELMIFNRSAAPAEALCRLINEKIPTCQVSQHRLDETVLKEALSTADVLVNTTNVGMGDLEKVSLIKDAAWLHSKLKVVDIIYSPPKTKLLEIAETAGCQTVNGIGMVVGQGALAFEIWTGAHMPVADVKSGILANS
ncbi:shikimate dehydrogenase [Anoxynatronum buryatiense]|uniref:Shikimate dehydrogenase (NADP(+)) n=1 Tax=Anoxynatronum buryatiense TaxID=489973 RepID=A0AA46AID2_9CLOT|nr:shikimate dehydrogenase [Anoxynatronum buryatiense]SMP48620.1 shikimate dehydrogenase [Anoxynatronum buryatiense]